MEMEESAMLTTRGKDKAQANKKGKEKVPPQANSKKEPMCFFCKKKGHVKRDASNFRMGLRRNVINSHLFVMNPI